MLVTYLVTVFVSYAGNTINNVQVQPSMEICKAAKEIHLQIPRNTPAFSSERDISKPILVDCIQKEVPMELKP